MNARSLTSEPSRFLTLAETARTLSITHRMAYSLVNSGELPAIRIGTRGHWRIERAVLESYIEALYEETRRRSAWSGSRLASVTELRFERPERSL